VFGARASRTDKGPTTLPKPQASGEAAACAMQPVGIRGISLGPKIAGPRPAATGYLPHVQYSSSVQLAASAVNSMFGAFEFHIHYRWPVTGGTDPPWQWLRVCAAAGYLGTGFLQMQQLVAQRRGPTVSAELDREHMSRSERQRDGVTAGQPEYCPRKKKSKGLPDRHGHGALADCPINGYHTSVRFTARSTWAGRSHVFIPFELEQNPNPRASANFC
jgi:hypothetical protein